MHDPTWQPPGDFLRITTIDLHTGGEPLRVVLSGLPPLQGTTVLEKRRYFREHYDHLRTGLMFEPRGHADMYGAVLTESTTADYDVFFLHNEGYSTMCGHAIIALTKLVIEAGRIQGERVAFNVPAGRIESRARIEAGRVIEATFRNVPSFLYRRDQVIDTEVGQVKFDIAFGGAFYAIVEAEPLNLALDESAYARLIAMGRAIKHAIMKTMPIEHPFEPDLSFLYGTIFTGPARQAGHHSRNVCIFADGEVDRSATGSGVSARAALHYAKGEVALNRPITIESILGSTMTVRAVEQTTFGAYDAVIPEVSGTAHFTGRNEFWFDSKDPLRAGFILR
ncbi:MAG TPA: proline racemase family protein [Steroidobacteraceae bacterium]|nr:proline racemase family protein [Steroidobacteraceae bacterium]